MADLSKLTPGTWNVDAVHSNVAFSVRHLVVAKTRGRFGSSTATVTIAEDPLQSKVEATVQTAVGRHRRRGPRQPPAHRRLLRGRDLSDDDVRQHGDQARRRRLRARPVT